MINIEAIKERDRKLLEEAKQKDYDYIHECFKVAYQKVLECLESGEYRDSDGCYNIPFEELLPDDFEESLCHFGVLSAKSLLKSILELNLGVLSITSKDTHGSYCFNYITIDISKGPNVWYMLACNQRQITDYYKSCIFVTTSISVEYARGFKYSPVKDFDIYDKTKEDDFIRWFKAEIEKSPDESKVTPDSDLTKPESTPDEPVKELKASDNLCKAVLLGGLSGILLGTLVAYIF